MKIRQEKENFLIQSYHIASDVIEDTYLSDDNNYWFVKKTNTTDCSYRFWILIINKEGSLRHWVDLKKVLKEDDSEYGDKFKLLAEKFINMLENNDTEVKWASGDEEKKMSKENLEKLKIKAKKNVERYLRLENSNTLLSKAIKILNKFRYKFKKYEDIEPSDRVVIDRNEITGNYTVVSRKEIEKEGITVEEYLEEYNKFKSKRQNMINNSIISSLKGEKNE